MLQNTIKPVQCDAIFLKKVISTALTVANADNEDIILGNKTLYRAFEIKGYAESSTDYDFFHFRIKHDGTTPAITPIILDTEISGLTYTANIDAR